MNPKHRPLLLLLVLIALLTVAILIVTLVGKEEEPDRQPQETEDVSYLTLASVNPETITAIDYIYQGASPVRLVKTDLWRLVSDDSLPVNQIRASTLANAMSTVVASRLVLETTEDYDQFGLANPDTKITLTYRDGSDITFLIGKKNNHVLGTYYLKSSASPAVYLVSENMLPFFAYTENQMLALDTLPDVEADDITALTVENPRGTGVALSAQGNGATRTWTATYGTGETVVLSDEDLIGDLLHATLMLTLTDPVWCRPLTPDKAAEYGLDAPTTVVMSYTVKEAVGAGAGSSGAVNTVEKQWKLSLGSTFKAPAETAEGQTQKEYVYVMVDGTGYVYQTEFTQSKLLIGDFRPEI